MKNVRSNKSHMNHSTKKTLDSEKIEQVNDSQQKGKEIKLYFDHTAPEEPKVAHSQTSPEKLDGLGLE